MGKMNEPGGSRELARWVVTGTLNAPGDVVQFHPTQGYFNMALMGAWSGVVVVEKTYDATLTTPEWTPVAMDNYGTPALFSLPVTQPAVEAERGMTWRFRLKELASGSVKVRASGGVAL